MYFYSFWSPSQTLLINLSIPGILYLPNHIITSVFSFLTKYVFYPVCSMKHFNCSNWNQKCAITLRTMPCLCIYPSFNQRAINIYSSNFAVYDILSYRIFLILIRSQRYSSLLHFPLIFLFPLYVYISFLKSYSQFTRCFLTHHTLM